MLVYENMKKKPIREVVLQEEEKDSSMMSLECADTATSRDVKAASATGD